MIKFSSTTTCFAFCVTGMISIVSVTASAGSTIQPDIGRLFRGEVQLRNSVKLKGEQYWESKDGNQLGFAYYGHKYGRAGRFEHSVENTDFGYMDVMHQPKLGYACLQLPKPKLVAGLNVFHRNLSMNEDCLYLDVYVPPIKVTQRKKWPVLFWIYGGGFVMGDKDMYNASILARSLDAIVVTFNYRLSVFGFFSTGDDTARGNWALGDIKLALNWTRSNIASFNGDPSRITIVGESAGGILTSAIMLDDQVRDGVVAAVVMSGSIVVPWAITRRAATVAGLLANEVNCTRDTTLATLFCLKSKSADELLNAFGIIQDKAQETGIFLAYSPTIDGLHIKKEPLEILKDRTTIPSLNSNAGNFISGYLKEDNSFALLGSPHLLDTPMNFSTAIQLLRSSLPLKASACPTDVDAQIKLLFDFYGLSEANTSGEIRQAYYTITTDMIFALGSIVEAGYYANTSRSAGQMYMISFDAGFQNLGAFHFMDVLHMFRGYLDIMMQEKMSDAVTRSLHDFFRQVLYNGRSNGPLFRNDGRFWDLTQQAIWVAKRCPWTPLLTLWNKVNRLGCDDV